MDGTAWLKESRESLELAMVLKGLSPGAASLLAGTANRSVRLVSTRDEEAASEWGATRLGGHPDVQEGFEWPRRKRTRKNFMGEEITEGEPLSFLGQINLAQIGDLSLGEDGMPPTPLPQTGMLYFFYDARIMAWGFNPDDEDGFAVIHDTPPEGHLERVKPPESDPEVRVFEPVLLEPVAQLVPLASDDQMWDALEIPDSDHEKLYDFLDRQEIATVRDVGGSLQAVPDGQHFHVPIHRLLGKPEIIQNPMELECQMVTNGFDWGNPTWMNDPKAKSLLASAFDEWRLLLQVDTDLDTEMDWGSFGRLYFWIRDEDLKRGDFSGCWTLLQTT